MFLSVSNKECSQNIKKNSQFLPYVGCSLWRGAVPQSVPRVRPRCSHQLGADQAARGAKVKVLDSKTIEGEIMNEFDKFIGRFILMPACRCRLAGGQNKNASKD